MSRCSQILIACVFVFLSTSVDAAPGALAGRWKAMFSSDGGERIYFIDLVRKGKEIGGDFISPRSGKHPIHSVSIEGKNVKIQVEREFDGNQVMLEIRGKFDEKGKVNGALYVEDNEFATFIMTKLPSPVGTWKVKSYSPDGDQEYQSTLIVKRTAKGLEARSSSDRGETKMNSVAWKDEFLIVKFDLDLGGNLYPITLDLAFKDENTLAGKWKGSGNDGTEYVGEWGAKREIKYALAGRWDIQSGTDDGPQPSVLKVSSKGGKLAGFYSGALGEGLAVSALKLESGGVKFELPIERDGNPIVFLVEAKFKNADTIEGRWSVRDFAEYSGTWTAKRAARKSVRFIGKWKASAVLASGDSVDFEVKLGEKSGKLSGTLTGRRGTSNLRKIELSDSKLMFTYDFERSSGDTIAIKFTGGLNSAGAIEGEWSTDDSSGRWSATRAPGEKDTEEKDTGEKSDGKKDAVKKESVDL